MHLDEKSSESLLSALGRPLFPAEEHSLQSHKTHSRISALPSPELGTSGTLEEGNERRRSSREVSTEMDRKNEISVIPGYKMALIQPELRVSEKCLINLWTPMTQAPSSCVMLLQNGFTLTQVWYKCPCQMYPGYLSTEANQIFQDQMNWVLAYG
ncbi:hypothetical protein WISP_149096 [Willisornis vidua]|uniref:Uncharacterized protein n=1 Tax=Willisornis vidua TaxID=1566151 RepID=A0ABQ9CK06_9PASS|nr:hypothetical protein WISP_149096 [Willisornis vidua]